MLFNKFQNKYIIKGVLRANTPLHIGAGQDSLNPIQTDEGVIVDHNGKPYIPGSSLKGVLRTYLEIMINSGINPEYESCLIVNEPCLDESKVKQIKSKYDNEKLNKDLKIAQEIYENMCDVCKVFGSKYFSSKISIRDCTLISEKAYIQKRDGVAIDRDTGTAADNKKYDYEQVSAGTEFDFYLSIDNLEDKHIDLFKIILNALIRGDIQIGGKTTYGLGSVQLTDSKVYRITSENLNQYLLSGVTEEMRWDYVQ